MNKNYLHSLDQDQLAAVLAPTDKSILVLAGAGSGKTRVLVGRMSHLIQGLGYPPSSIIATTFTRAAAEEIKSRVSQIVGPSASEIQASTIHSLCLKIARDRFRRVDVIESPLQRRIVSDAIDEAYDSERIPRNDRRRIGWRYWMQWVDWAKTSRKSTSQEFLDQMEHSRPNATNNMLFSLIAAKVLNSYESAKGPLCDFTDMLWKARDLLDDANVLSELQSKYKYVLVDEFQDTSKLQHDILSMIAKGEHLFAAADPDQSLYAWRMADPADTVFGFQDRYPNGVIYKLGTNYRSTQSIVKTGKRLIHQNYLSLAKSRYEKNIFPSPNALPGVSITSKWFYSHIAEANYILVEVKFLLNTGATPGDIFILARTNAALALTEEGLTTEGIPCISAHGCYWNNPHVASVLDYISLAHDVSNDKAFLSVYDIPSTTWSLTTRRLGRKFIEEIQNQPEGSNLWEKMINALPTQPSFRKRAIGDFVGYVQHLQRMLESEAVSDVVELVCVDYTSYWVRREGEQTTEDMESLEPLPMLVSKYSSWRAFMGMVSATRFAVKDLSSSNAIVLSTIHGVKGLERPIVFGIGLSDGLLPHWMSTGKSVWVASKNGEESLIARSAMPPSCYDGTLEDERCAAYVLITRAKDRLYLLGSQSSGRKVKMDPSPFFKESGLSPQVQRVCDKCKNLDIEAQVLDCGCACCEECKPESSKLGSHIIQHWNERESTSRTPVKFSTAYDLGPVLGRKSVYGYARGGWPHGVVQIWMDDGSFAWVDKKKKERLIEDEASTLHKWELMYKAIGIKDVLNPGYMRIRQSHVKDKVESVVSQ